MKYITHPPFIILALLLFSIGCTKTPPQEGNGNVTVSSGTTSVTGSNKPPVANAGPDQIITLPSSSTMLDGTQSHDPDGIITSWLWRKISGPSSLSIVNPDVSKTQLKDLAKGIYVFELKVTDNGGLSASDTLQVVVNEPQPSNWWLSVSIYPQDTLLNLSGNSIGVNAYAYLNGQGTPPAPVLNSVGWRKVAGSDNYLIQTPNSLATTISNLTPGMYAFECKIVDTAGRKDSAITVIGVPDPSADQEIFLANQPWILDYGVPVYVGIDLNRHLPPGKSIKKIFFKQDCETEFTEVLHFRSAPANTFYNFGLGYENNNFYLWIAHVNGSCYDPGDTPDIKIVF